MKRISACFLAVVMTLTAVPLGSLAGIEPLGFSGLFSLKTSAVGEQDFEYIIQNGDAVLTKCNTEISGDVVIPDTLGGCPVTRISLHAFYGSQKMESVKIPDSVKTIDAFAFQSCTELKSVDFGGGVTFIGEEAFRGCTALTGITVPKTVTRIDANAFRGCTALASITLPDSLAGIGSGVFHETAWYNAQPFGFVYIGKLLYGYKGTMPANTVLKVTGGTKGIADSACFRFANLVSVTVPDSVVNIGGSAFSYCTGLKEIRLGKNVETIGDSAFCQCTSLLSLVIPEKVKQISSNMLKGCSLLLSVSLPKALESIDDFAFFNCYRLTELIMPDSVTEIGRMAFFNCTDLKYMKLSEKLTRIDEYAFKGCGSLRYLHIPESVTDIAYAAFYGCKSLTDIVIPGAIKYIGDFAFGGCSGLRNVTIQNGVETVGSSAFVRCQNIRTVKIGSDVRAIKPNAFQDLSDFPAVYYAGSESAWTSIVIDETNDILLRGKISFNCDISHTHSYETVILSKATMTQDGKYVKLCKVCSDEYSSGVIEKACSAVLSQTKYTYDAKAKTPAVTVRDSKGRTLKNGRDYTLTYSSGRKNVGKYAVRITFKGNYSGKTYLYFDILPGVTSKLDAAQSTSAVTLTWKAVAGATGYRVYLFDAKTKKYSKLANTKAVSYTVGKLQAGTNYQFAVRAYTIVGKDVIWSDGYRTVVTATKPGTPSLTVTSGAKKALLKWTKQTGATGYVVYMSASKNGTYSKVAVVKGSLVVSYVKTGLTTGKTCYFKVAAYKTAGGKNIYGGFSAVKAVKIK